MSFVSPDSISLAIFGVLIRISQTGIMPVRSDFSISFIETMARRTRASCDRSWFC